jgi:hypothetical protein
LKRTTGGRHPNSSRFSLEGADGHILGFLIETVVFRERLPGYAVMTIQDSISCRKSTFLSNLIGKTSVSIDIRKQRFPHHLLRSRNMNLEKPEEYFRCKK